jgi:hypothetical protein
MKFVDLAMILVTPKETLKNASWGAKNGTCQALIFKPGSPYTTNACDNIRCV